MRADPIARTVRALRPRRNAGDRVRETIMMLGEARGKVIGHEETPWASITFAGSRHELVLEFCGTEAVAAGEQLIERLPDHEFVIPGHLVADATVTSVDHRMLPVPRLIVTAILLLLDDV